MLINTIFGQTQIQIQQMHQKSYNTGHMFIGTTPVTRSYVFEYTTYGHNNVNPYQANGMVLTCSYPFTVQ